MDIAHLGCFWLVWKFCYGICVWIFVLIYVVFSLGCIPRSGISELCVKSMFKLLRTVRLLPEGMHHFTFPQRCTRVAISLYPWQHLWLSIFSIAAVLLGMKWYLTLVLIYITMMANDFLFNMDTFSRWKVTELCPVI